MSLKDQVKRSKAADLNEEQRLVTALHFGAGMNMESAIKTGALLYKEHVQPLEEKVKSLQGEDGIDCDFFYFKPSGKWKYEGQGRWPRKPEDHEGWWDVDRDSIIRENGGMPGLATGSRAANMVVLVIPRSHCDCPVAYPRMLSPEEAA